MAFTPTTALKSDPTILLRDPQHAARLFTDDQFRLAPKQKFLFHVAFNINEAACKDINLVQRHKNEIGMLVKNIDLPGFDVTVETVNQYNRKRKVQITHKYKDITVAFHDDNMGVINQLWQNYYSYYYADSKSAGVGGAFAKTATKNFNSIVAPYGLDNGSDRPFFNYIIIYQMARHEFVSYKLINPVIQSWSHNKVDYSSGNTPHDNAMTLGYEAVEYNVGVVNSQNVVGFGTEHYDQTPSPLTGGSANSASPSFNDSAELSTKAAEFYSNSYTSINTYQNTQQKNIAGTSALSVVATAQQGVSGVAGVAFPTSAKANVTPATAIKLG
jgi:hypothetical protein